MLMQTQQKPLESTDIALPRRDWLRSAAKLCLLTGVAGPAVLLASCSRTTPAPDKEAPELFKKLHHSFEPQLIPFGDLHATGTGERTVRMATTSFTRSGDRCRYSITEHDERSSWYTYQFTYQKDGRTEHIEVLSQSELPVGPTSLRGVIRPVQESGRAVIDPECLQAERHEEGSRQQ